MSTQMQVLIGVLAAIVVLLLITLAVVVTSDDETDVATGSTTTTAAPDDSTTTTAGPDDSTTTTDTTTTSTTEAQPDTQPVIVAGGYVMGYWDGARWVSLTNDDGSPLPPSPVSGGEPYLFVDAEGSTLRTPLAPVEEGCYLGTSYGVYDPATFDLVGIPEGTTPFPRPVRTESPSPEHLDAVRAWLVAEGVENPEPLVDRVIRVDLDGDGRDEVFIEASRGADGGFSEEPGGYSVILYRYVDGDDQVQTVVVAGDSVSQDEMDSEFAIVFVHRILAVADLSEDGRFELVTSSSFYEGESIDVRTVLGPRIDVVLSTGCGA